MRLAVALVFLMLPVSAFAETRAADVQVWLCRVAPKAQRCRVAVPPPPARPAEILPPTKVGPKPEPSVRPAPEPAVAPKGKAKQQQRQKQKLQAKQQVPKPNQEQRPLLGGGQAAPATLRCKPLPPKDCNQICKYARHMSAEAAEELGVFLGYCRPTTAQKSSGKACIRSHCPEALTK